LLKDLSKINITIYSNMVENQIEKEFKKYKNLYLRIMGNHALDNDELDEMGRHLFGIKYRGSYAQDHKFQIKPGYYIINTDIAKGDGIHWLAGVATKKTFYLYDSFGRNLSLVVPLLLKRLAAAGYKVKSDTKDKEQRITYNNKLTVSCGHACLAFLMIAHKHGIRKAMLI
jgi:hypothetical protein